jgi:hypothetical protein
MSIRASATAHDLLRAAPDTAAPGWKARYRLGVMLNKELEHYATLTEVAEELGITRQNAYTETVLALGSLAFAVAARYPKILGLQDDVNRDRRA